MAYKFGTFMVKHYEHYMYDYTHLFSTVVNRSLPPFMVKHYNKYVFYNPAHFGIAGMAPLAEVLPLVHQALPHRPTSATWLAAALRLPLPLVVQALHTWHELGVITFTNDIAVHTHTRSQSSPAELHSSEASTVWRLVVPLACMGCGGLCWSALAFLAAAGAFVLSWHFSRHHLKLRGYFSSRS